MSTSPQPLPTFRSNPLAIVDAPDWRAAVLALVLRGATWLGAVVLVPSVAMALAHDMWAVAATDVLAWLMVLAAHLAPRLGTLRRTLVFGVASLMVATVLLVEVGPVSQIYMFAFAIVTTLLIGTRAGLAAVGLASAVLVAAGVMGLAHPTMAVAGWPTHELGGWLVMTSNFAFLGVLLVLGTGAIIEHLERSLAVVERARATAADQHRRLVREVEARQQSERRFEQLTRHLRDVFFVRDVDSGRVSYVSPAYASVWGLSEADLLESEEGLFPGLSAAHTQRLREARVRQAGGEATRVDVRLATGEMGGEPRWVREWAWSVDAADGDRQVVGIWQDVTAIREAERTARRLEEQLRVARKMDAIGRLAGGVAHDFNNLLGVILGHAELAREALKPGTEVHDDLDMVVDAAERSAALVGQLLAFSRKQVAEPRRIDVNDRVTASLPLLQSLAPFPVQLVWRPSEQPAVVRLDPVQLDQILSNLIINARAAIEGDGSIVLQSGWLHIDRASLADLPELTAGAFVELCVSDTGVGMDRETLSHIFEPFFTTRPVGRGTGLGLATVYGIVRQNGGFVRVYSEIGKGTTFRVYLPAADGPIDDVAGAPSAQPDRDRGGTVLLVEDDEPLRALSERMLRRLGYEVVAASSAEEAETLYAQHGGVIDLLMTDVMLPAMNGAELARRLRADRPSLPCLFVSGFTADLIDAHGLLEEGVHFVGKPFTAHGLAMKLDEVQAAATETNAPPGSSDP